MNCKHFVLLVIAVMVSTFVSGCSNVVQEDYDAALETIETITAQNEDLQAQLDALNEDYQKLNAEKDILQKQVDSAKATPTPAPEVKTANSPWVTPLPDGLSAEYQLIDDDCTMLIHYYNDTGKDIALTTYSLFGDANGDPFMEGASSMMYFADGTERIEILDAWDEIVYFSLDYEIGEPYKKIKEANEALSVDSWRNSDNSISATFSSSDGASVDGNLFFLDDDGSVLGYQSFGIGFADSMDYDFDAPDYDYTDYLLCFEAMS